MRGAALFLLPSIAFAQRADFGAHHFSVEPPPDWKALSQADIAKLDPRADRERVVAAYVGEPGQPIPRILISVSEKGRIDPVLFSRGPEWEFEAASGIAWSEHEVTDPEHGRLLATTGVLPTAAGWIRISGHRHASEGWVRETTRAVARSVRVDANWRYRPRSSLFPNWLAGALALLLAAGTSWWNRTMFPEIAPKRPNWWKLALGVLFGVAAAGLLFDVLRGRATTGEAIVRIAFATALLSVIVTELPWVFRRPPVPGTILANPWKVFLCSGGALRAANSLADPFQGPLLPDNDAQLVGMISSQVAIAAIFGWLTIAELRKLRKPARTG